MTVREKLIGDLVNHGVWPEDAKEVMNAEAADNKSMEGRWDENIAGYPPQLIPALWYLVSKRAADYLEAKNPMNFVIAMLRG